MSAACAAYAPAIADRVDTHFTMNYTARILHKYSIAPVGVSSPHHSTLAHIPRVLSGIKGELCTTLTHKCEYPINCKGCEVLRAGLYTTNALRGFINSLRNIFGAHTIHTRYAHVIYACNRVACVLSSSCRAGFVCNIIKTAYISRARCTMQKTASAFTEKAHTHTHSLRALRSTQIQSKSEVKLSLFGHARACTVTCNAGACTTKNDRKAQCYIRGYAFTCTLCSENENRTSCARVTSPMICCLRAWRCSALRRWLLTTCAR